MVNEIIRMQEEEEALPEEPDMSEIPEESEDLEA